MTKIIINSIDFYKYYNKNKNLLKDINISNKILNFTRDNFIKFFVLKYKKINSKLMLKYFFKTLIKNFKNSSICSICLGTVQKKIFLHCGHYFHEKCIIKWLSTCYTCPLCRIQI